MIIMLDMKPSVLLGNCTLSLPLLINQPDIKLIKIISNTRMLKITCTCARSFQIVYNSDFTSIKFDNIIKSLYPHLYHNIVVKKKKNKRKTYGQTRGIINSQRS